MVEKVPDLGRRSRSHPQSTGKPLKLTPRDLLWLAKLQEHGPLPSSFLLEYCKDTHRNRKRSGHRLTKLFNENNTADQGSYLSRPAQQARTENSRYNQLVYDLSKSGKKALARERPGAFAARTNTGPWVHQLMVSCITSSIELACIDRSDINFISGSAILVRAKAELRCDVEVDDPSSKQRYTKALIPDALFGLEYVSDEGRAFRFFALEADRATEPATSSSFNRKSVLRSLLQYQAYIEGGVYRDHLGLTAPLLALNVANSKTRMDKMLEVTARHFPAGNSYMLFAVWEDFGPAWKPPQPNADLLNGLWKRAGAEEFNISSA